MKLHTKCTNTCNMTCFFLLSVLLLLYYFYGYICRKDMPLYVNLTCLSGVIYVLLPLLTQTRHFTIAIFPSLVLFCGERLVDN